MTYITNHPIIAFCGFAGSGKTTAATYAAEEFGGVCIPFAYPIKQLAVHHFGWDGKKDAKGRRLLQVLGTEAGRAYDPDIWVHHWRAAVEERNRVVVVDDLRFDNEACAIRAASRHTLIVEIVRPRHGDGGHASERGISRPHIDLTVFNNGSVAELQRAVRTYIDDWMYLNEAI